MGGGKWLHSGMKTSTSGVRKIDDFGSVMQMEKTTQAAILGIAEASR
jgi:hypothetical protein